MPFADVFVEGFRIFLMGMSLVGAIASSIDAEIALGREWRSGLQTLPDLFMAIGGVLCARPIISVAVDYGFGWFAYIGSTSAMAGCMLLGIDMGGNQVAQSLTESVEDYYVAGIVAYSLGVTVSFNIPVGLLMIRQEDQKFFALGTVAGVLATPVAALVTYAFLALQRPMVNTAIAVHAPTSHELRLDLWDATMQLTPVIGFGALLVIGMMLSVQTLLRWFLRFGRGLDMFIRVVFWACATEMLTQCFTSSGVPWPFAPLLGNGEAGLEISGTIAVMLTGIYPLVYILRTRLVKPLNAIGKRAGLCEAGVCGCVACMCNTIAMFSAYSDMTLESKVLSAAFMVCGSLTLGDYLAYCSVYQPGILPAVVFGKVVGAVVAMPIAWFSVVPVARKLSSEKGEYAALDANVSPSRINSLSGVKDIPSPDRSPICRGSFSEPPRRL